jgi:hypothetical protein
MHHVGRKRGWIVRVLVLGAAPLVLGLLTTWAVAWGVWLRQDARSVEDAFYDPIDPEQRLEVLRARKHGYGWDYDHYWLLTPDPASVPIPFLCSLEEMPRTSYAKRAWRWGEAAPTGASTDIASTEYQPRQLVHKGRVATNARRFEWVEYIAGWPLRSATMYKAPDEEQVFDALELPSWLNSLVGNSHDIPVPTRPIWPGMIANTLIYGAAWAALFVTPGIARGRLRAWRGRCPRCGYDLRHQASPGCPECGWKRAG